MWANPGVVLEHGELGDKGLAVNPYVVPDLDVVLDHGQGAHADMVTNAVQLTDIHFVTGLEAMTNDVPGIDHRVRTHMRLRAQHGLQLALGRPARRNPDDAVIFNDRLRPQTHPWIEPIIAHDSSSSLRSVLHWL